jgi:endonuclease/exonuclease/phosphatase family metal-dependent hydrolase
MATWNIWGNGEPWRYMSERGEVRGAVPESQAVTAQPADGVWVRRRALLVAALQSVDVDLVALQEVERDPAERTAHSDELATALHWNVAGPTPGGLAVLTRHRIANSTTVPLKRQSDGYGADEAFHVVVSQPEGDLDVVVAHLTPRSGESRVEAAQAIVRYLDRLPERALAVMGDFNTVDIHTPELDVLRRFGLHDASFRAGPTMPSHDPTVRLDYILVGRGLTATEATRIGAEPDADGYYASDHLGVLVKAQLD